MNTSQSLATGNRDASGDSFFAYGPFVAAFPIEYCRAHQIFVATNDCEDVRLLYAGDLKATIKDVVGRFLRFPLLTQQVEKEFLSSVIDAAYEEKVAAESQVHAADAVSLDELFGGRQGPVLERSTKQLSTIRGRRRIEVGNRFEQWRLLRHDVTAQMRWITNCPAFGTLYLYPQCRRLWFARWKTWKLDKFQITG